MGSGKDILHYSAVVATGLVGTIAVPVLTGGLSAVGLSGPLNEVLKDLIKGVTGDHFPGFRKALSRRLFGLDASKLNHDLQKALEYAVDETGRSLRTLYENPVAGDGSRGERKSTKADREVLNEVCMKVKAMLRQTLSGGHDRYTVDGLISGAGGEGRSIRELMEAIEAEKGRTGPALQDLVVAHFHEHFRLHFLEFIKEDGNGKARVAFEQLTSDTILSEIRSIKQELKKITTQGPGALGEGVAASVAQSGQAEVLDRNITEWESRYGQGDTLRMAMAPALDTSINDMLRDMKQVRIALDGIHRDVLVTGQRVERTKEAVHKNTWLTLVVLFAVLGLAALFVLDPMHLRSFPLKVVVDQPFDYGMDDRVAARIAIAYGQDVYDTADVVNGQAAFAIPNSYRNDDAVLRLLCFQYGQGKADARICDSGTVRMTDLERLRFPLTGKGGGDARVVEQEAAADGVDARNKVSTTGGEERTAVGPPAERITEKAGAVQTAPPPCSVDGLEFLSEGSLEDRLVLSAMGGNKIAISGEVNRKPVQGVLRANGSALTAVSGEGTVLGGSLQLVQGCGQLKGTLSLRSPTGNVVSERVNMVSDR
ncbi:MAG TPA: hypothetical protein PLB89_10805 [Flavobacteriales bacterium]|nr:hypothetical protein [Flavobacteriales bacterium]